MGGDFALDASTRNCINYLPVDAAVLTVNIHFMISPAVGSITVG